MIGERNFGEIRKADSTADTSQRKAAIVAGLGLLLMMIPAIFSNYVVIQDLIVPGDAASTAANFLANEPQFRMSILGFTIVAILDVLVSWALYVFFRPVNKSLSLLTAWFRLVYTVILVVAVFNLLDALRLLTDVIHLTLFAAEEIHAQALLSLNAFNDEWAFALILFGVHLVLLGYLAFKSGYMSKILGILVIVAGLGYLIDSLSGLLFPNLGVAIGLFTFMGEILLAIWLLIKGLNVKVWEKSTLQSV